MVETNKYGLTRNIPSAVREAVRQRDGFGCVHCGNPFYQFDHFSPEFAQATSHEVDGIILLCADCHAKKGGVISIEAIRESAANPVCRREGHKFEAMDLGRGPLKIGIGSSTFQDVGILIRCQNEAVLAVKKPEKPGAPYLLSAKFQDREGKATIEIVDNQWRIGADVWDVKRKGSLIVVRKAKGKIALAIRLVPGRGLVIEQMDMLFQNTRILVKPRRPLRIRLGDWIHEINDYVAERVPVGIDIVTRSLHVGSGMRVPEGYAGAARGEEARISIGSMETIKAKAKDGPSLYPPEIDAPPELTVTQTDIRSNLDLALKPALQISVNINNETEAATELKYTAALAYAFAYPVGDHARWQEQVDSLAAKLLQDLYDHTDGNANSPLILDDYDDLDIEVPVFLKAATSEAVSPPLVFVVLFGIKYRNRVSPQWHCEVSSCLLTHISGRPFDRQDFNGVKLSSASMGLRLLYSGELAHPQF